MTSRIIKYVVWSTIVSIKNRWNYILTAVSPLSVKVKKKQLLFATFSLFSYSCKLFLVISCFTSDDANTLDIFIVCICWYYRISNIPVFALPSVGSMKDAYLVIFFVLLYLFNTFFLIKAFTGKMPFMSLIEMHYKSKLQCFLSWKMSVNCNHLGSGNHFQTLTGSTDSG